MAWRTRVLLILAFLVACSGTQRVPDDVDNTLAAAAVGLGPDDVFEVRVYGDENLSAQYRVESDGTIDFPFLGRVSVAGKSSRDVAEMIAQGLREREILVDPQVTVYVSESNSMRITVMGAVARAGTFPMRPGMQLIEVISLAGGFTALADANETVLTRRTEDGEVRRFTIPARRISDGREGDIAVQGGDMIFVPERAF